MQNLEPQDPFEDPVYEQGYQDGLYDGEERLHNLIKHAKHLRHRMELTIDNRLGHSVATITFNCTTDDPFFILFMDTINPPNDPETTESVVSPAAETRKSLIDLLQTTENAPIGKQNQGVHLHLGWANKKGGTKKATA